MSNTEHAKDNYIGGVGTILIIHKWHIISSNAALKGCLSATVLGCCRRRIFTKAIFGKVVSILIKRQGRGN